jgi:hypothetical protein
MELPRASQQQLSQGEERQHEEKSFGIETLISDPNVKVMINSISHHINIQYMIVEKAIFSLTVGRRKW